MTDTMAVSQPLFRAAAVQAAPVFLDLDASIDKAIGLIAEAAAKGVRLFAFPETWLPGYPGFSGLDSPARSMQFIQRHRVNSRVDGSPQAERLMKVATDHAIMVVPGHSEKAGGRLSMAQWIIDAEGHMVAQRPQLLPTHLERTICGGGDGSDLTVHDTALGRIGALCGREHLQPLSKYAMYAQSEPLHIAAWPSFSLYRGGACALVAEVNNAASRIHAVEGRCFVLAPRATGSKEMVQLLCGEARHQAPVAARRRWHHGDLRARGPVHDRAAARGHGRHRLRRARPRHHLAREGRCRPGRPLRARRCQAIAVRQDPA